MRIFVSSALMLAVATCTTQQIDIAANAACAIATSEANAYTSSTDPNIKMAVGAVQASCADPAATTAQVNAARVLLKNKLKGA